MPGSKAGWVVCLKCLHLVVPLDIESTCIVHICLFKDTNVKYSWKYLVRICYGTQKAQSTPEWGLQALTESGYCQKLICFDTFCAVRNCVLEVHQVVSGATSHAGHYPRIYRIHIVGCRFSA